MFGPNFKQKDDNKDYIYNYGDGLEDVKKLFDDDEIEKIDLFDKEKRNKETFYIFDDADVKKSLRAGKNPNEERIVSLNSIGAYVFMDRISGEYFDYKPSQKNLEGKPLGYSLEKITTSSGETIVASIAEYSEDRSLDRYRINGDQVTLEEYKAFLLKRKNQTILTEDRNRQ